MKAHIRYTERLSGRLDQPSSKNYTTRYLLAATLAEGESRFHGIGNLRLKECDRIAVQGNPEGYAGETEVPTYYDHRVAQMLSIVGLRCRQGLTVLDAENVGKSYPAFFEDLIGLGADIELEE